ncbi:MAG: deoxynucleoside kinase [Candidatus Nanoarchaeia archaeon]|nr:deoxynucleoside kinase [Candidatus Nanoarchaeia archaeon]
MTLMFSVEGLGATGKSTLIRDLSNYGLHVISEISEEFPETNEIQVFSSSPIMSREVNQWFLDKELKRFNLAKEFFPIAIFDRGLYSQIAYNFAKDSLYNTAELESLFFKLDKLENQKMISFPLMIYLAAPVEYSMDRMKERNKNTERKRIADRSPGYTYEFFELIRVAYDKISEVLGEKHLKLEIPKENNIIKKVNEWISDRSKLINIVNLEEIRRNLNVR